MGTPSPFLPSNMTAIDTNLLNYVTDIYIREGKHVDVPLNIRHPRIVNSQHQVAHHTVNYWYIILAANQNPR